MEDHCVCCGEIVPEGRMICVNCYEEANDLISKIENQKQEVNMDNDRRCSH